MTVKREADLSEDGSNLGGYNLIRTADGKRVCGLLQNTRSSGTQKFGCVEPRPGVEVLNQEVVCLSPHLRFR